jgi:hypothetical protein
LLRIEYIALLISLVSLSLSVWTWWHGTREENWAIDYELTDWGNVAELHNEDESKF